MSPALSFMFIRKQGRMLARQEAILQEQKGILVGMDENQQELTTLTRHIKVLTVAVLGATLVNIGLFIYQIAGAG